MPNVLEDILAQTRLRIEMAKQQVPPSDMQRRAQKCSGGVPFAERLRKAGCIQVIAEIKQASPSAGVIRKEDDVVGRVRKYARGGASALSIVTEERFFQGSPYLLEKARASTDLPLLRKDFIVDPYQIDESRCLGADAILLIAAALPGALLAEMVGYAHSLGLEALVEVHTEEEMSRALASGATAVGINNRDLKTLKVDPQTAFRLLAHVPPWPLVTWVVESGIRQPEELPALRDAGAHAVLIGETLMRADDPEQRVSAFVRAGCAGRGLP